MAISSEIARYILITGPPGVGKTTLVRRVCDQLKQRNEINVCGFYTEEVRDSNVGQRIGFHVVDVASGRRASLASSVKNPPGAPRVGKYAVVLDEFEPLALECLSGASNSNLKNRLIVIDEIGKMESFSRAFCDNVERLFDKNFNSNSMILATVPVDKGNLPKVVQNVKKVVGNRLITVTKENRENLVQEIVDLISKSIDDSR